MAARAWLFGLILGIPALGFVVSTGVRSHFDSQLRAAAREQVPDADPAALAGITVAQLCASDEAELRDLCQTDANLGTMRAAALGAGAVGLGLVGLIALAGVAAQSSRNILLACFRPGLYLTAVIITGLILVHAVIAIGIIYYGESILIDRVHFGIIAIIALGALAGVLAVARSAFGLVQKAETYAIGKTVSAEDAPRLWQQIGDVATRLGALPPDQVVVGLDPTFYVTEANVTTLSGKLTGRTLFCSLPLARILTVDEFTAIIGHELGHFRGDDTKFSERFYPIYRGTETALVSLQSAGGEGWGTVALLPAIAVFSFFLERFSVAERRHGRARELLADRAGAEATSPKTMASALVKVHAFAGVWNDFQHAAVEALKEGNIYRNASALFAEVVATAATPTALEGLADTHTSHPTDSHPPLDVRLGSLQVDLASVATEALAVAPDDSAATLVPDSESQEEELSQAFQVLLAQQMGIDLADADAPADSPRNPIAKCRACGTRVLPQRDGTCPSCGTLMTA